MRLKLKRKPEPENQRAFYLVSDVDKGVYYDYYEYLYTDKTPNIELICYKLISTELSKAYKNRDFTPYGFKALLLYLNGLIIENNKIDITSLKGLTDVIDNIRYKDLYNVINSFRKKLSLNSLDYFRNRICDIEIQELSKDTQEKYNSFINSIDYKNDRDELFREVMFLATINEYNKACSKVCETETFLTDLQDKVEKGLIYVDDEE